MTFLYFLTTFFDNPESFDPVLIFFKWKLKKLIHLAMDTFLIMNDEISFNRCMGYYS